MTCKDHTSRPQGYIDWHAWAEKMSKTHKQIRCPECGLFKIWVKRKSRADMNGEKQ